MKDVRICFALLLFLATSCDRESRPTARQHPTPPVAAVPAPITPDATPAGSPSNPITSGAAPVAAEETATTPVTPTPANTPPPSAARRRARPRAAARLTPPPPGKAAGSTSYAPAPRAEPDPLDPEPVPLTTHSQPTRSALPAEVRAAGALYAQFAKAPQTFRVTPTAADTVLVCAEGTRVTVPAAAFVDSATGQPINSPIELTVREYLTLADMVLNNLSTTSGDELLETGGMLKLEARAGGRPVKLRPGAALTLALPRKGPARPGMQIFYGEEHPQAHGPDWHPATGSRVELDTVTGKYNKHLGATPPVYVPGKYQLHQAIRQQLAFTREQGKALARRAIDAAEMRWLRAVRRNLRSELLPVDGFEILFDVTATGQVRNVRTRRGTDQRLKNAAVAAVTKLGFWKPGTCRDKPIVWPQKLLVGLYKKGEVIIRPTSTWQPKDCSLDTVVTYRSVFGRNVSNGDTTGPQSTSATDYIMRATRLGWINCDRYLGTGKGIAMRIDVPDAEVRLIFRRYRVILPGVFTPTGVVFSRVPPDEPVTVLAFRFREGVTEIATLQTTTSPATMPNLSFRPVSSAVLKEEIAKLEI